MPNNQQHANPTLTEYFNHLVNNNLIIVRSIRTIDNNHVNRLAIEVNSTNSHLFLMPEENHLKALQQYRVEGEQISGRDVYKVGLAEFLAYRINRLDFEEFFEDDHLIVHESACFYICRTDIRTIYDYIHNVLPHVSFD
ncbi:hypothetical protein ACFX5K_00630 [Rickettsiales bacterium LUAb2]